MRRDNPRAAGERAMGRWLREHGYVRYAVARWETEGGVRQLRPVAGEAAPHERGGLLGALSGARAGPPAAAAMKGMF